jgi:hypothetical protein
MKLRAGLEPVAGCSACCIRRRSELFETALTKIAERRVPIGREYDSVADVMQDIARAALAEATDGSAKGL